MISTFLFIKEQVKGKYFLDNSMHILKSNENIVFLQNCGNFKKQRKYRYLTTIQSTYLLLDLTFSKLFFLQTHIITCLEGLITFSIYTKSIDFNKLNDAANVVACRRDCLIETLNKAVILISTLRVTNWWLNIIDVSQSLRKLTRL